MDITSYLLGKKNGGVIPTGEIEITQNGITNVSGYATANVQVPQPSGSTTITTNGEHNVANYETANVQVPQPSGKINITQNGTDIDVSSYATADVAVPSTPAPLAVPFISFYNYRGTTSLDSVLAQLDTSAVTSMDYMFAVCSGLTSINASPLNTANVTSMNYMFQTCLSATSINVSGFNTAKVTSMSAMFNRCEKLTSLDLSSFTTTSMTADHNFNQMFKDCKNLTHLDMRNMDFSLLNGSSYGQGANSMFGYSSSNGVPDNCEIIVADATQKGYIQNYQSRLTNVKTVAEYGA